MTNYLVQSILARLSGDNNEVQAIKIAKKANVALKLNLASLDSDILNAENAIDEAKESLDAALYPTSFPSNNKDYVNSISRAQENVDEAVEKLEDLNASKRYYAATLTKFEAEAVEKIAKQD